MMETGEEALKANHEAKQKERESHAGRLVNLCAAENVEFFHDQHKTAYARFSMPCDIAANCGMIDVRGLLPPCLDKNVLITKGKKKKRGRIKDYTHRHHRKYRKSKP